MRRSEGGEVYRLHSESGGERDILHLSNELHLITRLTKGGEKSQRKEQVEEKG